MESLKKLQILGEIYEANPFEFIVNFVKTFLIRFCGIIHGRVYGVIPEIFCWANVEGLVLITTGSIPEILP